MTMPAIESEVSPSSNRNDGDERKQAEHAAALDENSPVADLCVRVGEDGPVAAAQRGETAARRARQVGAAETRGNRNRGCDHQRAEQRQHAAPAQEIADQPGQRGAEQITGHRACERASNRDLALVGSDEVADQRQRDWKDAARADAGQDAGDEQDVVRVRQRAENVGNAEQHQTNDHQPRLAENVGGRTHCRLHHREGEGEHGRETGRACDTDAEFVGHMRQHRIERAPRKARRKRRQRNDVQGWRQRGFHLAAFFAALLASASNAISVFTSPSNSRSGTMLGPSDGARSGSG